MIKIQELRIGNLVEYKFHDEWSMISITLKDFQIIERSPERYKPIIITPKRLIEFGLIKVANGIYVLGCYELSFNPIDEKWDVCLKGGVLTSIEYIHQLQNFYFVMSKGEELIIKTKGE